MEESDSDKDVEKVDLSPNDNDTDSMDDDSVTNLPSNKIRNIMIIAVVLIAVAGSTAFLLYSEDLQFDANKVPLGFTDTFYCKYALSDGSCLAEDKIDIVLPRGFATNCEDGFTKTNEPLMGDFCMLNELKSFKDCNDDFCYPIGIEKNFDKSKPKNYLSNTLIQAISDSALDVSTKISDSFEIDRETVPNIPNRGTDTKWDCEDTTAFGTIEECNNYWNGIETLAFEEGRYAMLMKLNDDGHLSDKVKDVIFDIEGIRLP